MNDKKITEMEWDNCPFKKIIINPFDAMMMVVVRRLDESYHELKNCKLPATETEFTLRNAKLCFYRELIKQSIDKECIIFPKAKTFRRKKSLLCMKTRSLREVLG